MCEHLLVMADDLAIGEGAIDGGAHGAEITLAKFRVDRRTGELAVWQNNSKLFG